MNTRRMCMVVLAACCSAAALAKPPFLGAFKGAYPKIPAGSALAKATCSTCHVSPPQLNPYGSAVLKALKASKAARLTPAILKQIETLDSDKDGVKNGAEIAKGTLPGDPKSK